MPTNPEQGDPTDASLDYNYGKQHHAPAETDPGVIALAEQSLKGLLALFQGDDGSGGTARGASLTPQSLAATSTLTASGSEATFTDWSADVADGDSYVPTVDIDDETYLDVRHLSYLRLRGEADSSTDANFNVYTRISAGDADKNPVSSKTVTGSSIDDLDARSVEGISYVRVTADQDATVYAGGSA